MKRYRYFVHTFCLFLFISCSDGTQADDSNPNPPVVSKTYNNLDGLVQDCADPYILKYGDLYYLYGTGGSDGIKVYLSKNLATWTKAQGPTDGYALHKKDVWGDHSFWAPEVYHINGRFYMFYSAEERIAVAESSSPLGPFVQTSELQKPFHDNIPEIDTHLFIDDDGKKYLYFVRFTNGNEIWAAELNADMRSIKESTITHCLGASQTWELVKGRVNEGPFILKHNGIYYLTYSANDYTSPKYGVGYATSNSPLGPWKKYDQNPILIGNDKIDGVGHHSFISSPSGAKYIVYHSHAKVGIVQPRKVGIDRYDFVPSTNGTADVLKVYGPTTTPQEVGEE